MRVLLIGVALLGWLPSVGAQEGAGPKGCLSPADIRQVVQGSRLIAPAAALQAAREAVPKGDIVRASLCHRDETLVYVIVTLRKDGRFVRVMVDAASGKVANVQ